MLTISALSKPLMATLLLMLFLSYLLVLQATIQFILAFTIPISQSFSSRSRNHPVGRIYHGNKAKPNQWPFMVSLQYAKQKNEHFCGGTILNAYTILSAAHCLNSSSLKPSDIQVMVGQIRLTRRTLPNFIYPVKSFTLNRHFGSLFKGHDIALVKLTKPINFKGSNSSTNIQPICLADSKATPIGEKCIVIGWGTTSDRPDKVSKDLLQAVVPIISPSDCKKIQLGYDFDEKQLICAGDFDKRTDACSGDSGGPLICPHEDNKKEYLQFGIVSFGVGCAIDNGFYTNVREQIAWIRKHA